MAQAYFAGRDAQVSAMVRTGWAKGRDRLPPYVEAATRPRKGLTGQPLWNAVDAMTSRLIH